jgi:anti-sigma regulatory factor (Ser/Thr protein kinase)
MNQTMKLFAASTLSVCLLGIFLGWRGSKLAQDGEHAELERSLQTELQLGQELFSSRLSQFEADVFNVISAEYLQHSNRTPGISSDLSDSAYSAVGLIEVKGSELEPLWWSIQSQAHDALTPELLKAQLPELQAALKTMGRHYFIRTLDLKSAPLMIFVSRIEIPNSQTPTLAMAVMAPSALKLGATQIEESLLWDQKGFLWGYENPSYIGSSLKNDPLVQTAIEQAEDFGKVTRPGAFPAEGKIRISTYARLPETNLFFGMSHEVPAVTDILSNWWASLLFAVLGASLLSIGMFRWLSVDRSVLELPTIPAQQPPPIRVNDEDEEMPEIRAMMDTPKAVHEQLANMASEIAVASTLAPVVETSPVQVATPAPKEVTVASSVESPEVQVLAKDAVVIDQVINRAIQSFRSRLVEEDIKFELNITEGLQIKAKAAQLQTALEEVLKNAIEAMSEQPLKKLKIEVVSEGGSARISIQDTGSGIAADNTARIFDAFFTTKQDKARGLGLTVVKRLLELVNGQSKIESAPGRGTTFSLIIPLYGSVVQEKPADSKKKVSQAVEAARSAFKDFLDDEVAGEPMTIAKVGQIAKNVDIRKPKVRMFD